jgi:hypothetical protein
MDALTLASWTGPRWRSRDGVSYSVYSDKVIDMDDEIHGLYLRTSLATDGT